MNLNIIEKTKNMSTLLYINILVTQKEEFGMKK